MKIDTNLYPEDESDMQLIEQLSAVRQLAVDELEMTEAEAGHTFLLFALAMQSDEKAAETTDTLFECPECGSGATDVEAAQIGGKPVVKPCGCPTEWGVLPDDGVATLTD